MLASQPPPSASQPPPAATVLGELAIFDQYLKLNGMSGIFGFLGHLLTLNHGIPAPTAVKAEDALAAVGVMARAAEQAFPQAEAADEAVRSGATLAGGEHHADTA